MGRTKTTPLEDLQTHSIKHNFSKLTLSHEMPKPLSHNVAMKTMFPTQKATLLRKKPMPLSHNIITSTASFVEMVAIFMIASAAHEFQAQVKDSEVLFICAGCHKIHRKHSRNDGIRPYFGFEDIKWNPILGAPVTIHGHSEMTSWSQICSDPILILHFVLQTIDPLGSPAGIMQEILRPYKPNDKLQYHEIVFDIGTMEKAEKHRLSMSKLVTELEHLPIKFEHVEVIVYSHSETT
ncbi:uncharacterized protein EDB93DRAFT_1106202 [Suillus bovinus]|uniref:uncharacterized protein n=1 Tax=Suillus bovinus TaxID=48563 RepID=UPI001B882A13|nr:uncharacterized protein EDB93DRAFT_1106202 [Suillus bovinus]KAG2139095.1 hypothetical protein EDB93DRAFT_1106202 [Suillus bovinus]